MRLQSALLGCALCAACGSPASAADKTYVVPRSTAHDARGASVYVDDAALKAAFPALADYGARYRTCATGMTSPPRLWVAFGPKVVAPHEGSIANVTCSFASREALSNGDGELTCDEIRYERVGFEDDPSRFFRAEPGVDDAEARAFLHALSTDTLRFADDVKKPYLAAIRQIDIDSGKDGALVVRYGDCGCTWTLQAQRSTGDRDRPFLVTKLDWMCV